MTNTAHRYAIVDIDDIICDRTRAFALCDQKYFGYHGHDFWNEFLSTQHTDLDQPIASGIAGVQALIADGFDITWLTGRPERMRDHTAQWLRDQDLPADQLIMRAETNRQKAYIWKSEKALDLIYGWNRDTPEFVTVVFIDNEEKIRQAVSRMVAIHFGVYAPGSDPDGDPAYLVMRFANLPVASCWQKGDIAGLLESQPDKPTLKQEFMNALSAQKE